METGIPARLSSAELRKFGLLVGGAFLALGALFRWRGNGVASVSVATLGAALVLGGVLIPSRLGPVYRAWMRLAVALSKVTTPIFMGLVYFVVITPVGLARRWFGGNPLEHESVDGGFWKARTPGERRSSLERQF